MNSKTNKWIISLMLGILILTFPIRSQEKKETNPLTPQEKLMESMHSISSHTLFDYVKELSSEKYGGRLTGTESYNESARWVADLLKKWGIEPAVDGKTYFQDFPNPYTLVFPGSHLILHVPLKKNVYIQKSYQFETDYVPGATSGDGEVKAEVVYVGYGISAPELKYDDYKGLDVKGKIVMMEREVPVSPDKEPEEFKKWRSYSFHQYKVRNAYDHGAVGMLYNYNIVNPNCLYIKGFILSNVGKSFIEDIFQGTGRTYKGIVEKIKATLKPQSFRTGKIVSIRNVTEHHPEGMGRNVLGLIQGSDPELKDEFIVLTAHLDHLGYCYEMMPGARDNASGVAVILGIAQAIKTSGLKPKRSILLIFFGSEEQGVKGSEYYLQHPIVPNEKIKALLNLDGVGRGKIIKAIAAKNYPQVWKYIDEANQKYIHQRINSTYFHNLARPRLDAAHFMWAGVPTLSFSAEGEEPLPYNTYHTTKDTPAIITPEIMEDLAQLLFISVMEMSEY